MRRFYPEQPLVGVGAVILDRGRILLEKRGNEPGRGKWSIPGGLVELGESVEQAVVREVMEETGLEVKDPRFIDIVENITTDERGKVRFHFIIIDYLVKLKGGQLRVASDAEELEWVRLDRVEEYDLTKTFRTFYQKNSEKLRTLSNEQSYLTT